MAYRFTLSMGTSLSARLIFCPYRTSIRTPGLAFRCPSMRAFPKSKTFVSRLHCFTHPVKVCLFDSLRNTKSFKSNRMLTDPKGERRIRVHTMCLPIASTVAEVIQSADQQCIVGLLAKMGMLLPRLWFQESVLLIFLFSFFLAVDRSLQSNIGDARDALVNVCVDVLSAYRATMSSASSGLYAPSNLRLLPLYIAALLKSVSPFVPYFQVVLFTLFDQTCFPFY